MVQTSFRVKEDKIEDQTLNAFRDFLFNQFKELVLEIPDRLRLQEIIRGRTLMRDDLRHRTKPEDATEDILITPILEFLGYKQNVSYFRRTGSNSGQSRKECDYTLFVDQEKILVESEPLGKNLFKVGVGVKQLAGYLDIRSFNSEIGIATNGLNWVLVKYNVEKFGVDVIDQIDLLSFLQEFLGTKPLDNTSAILENFYRTFSKQFIVETAKELEITLDISKKNVSRKFYNDYIKLVFGVENNGEHSYCLIDGIQGSGLTEVQKRKFAITLMNRLIFIKFLEDRVLTRNNLLKDLLDNYNSLKEKENTLNFYDTYLKKLFYKVFNTSIIKRDYEVSNSPFFSDLPYLNGGLFRESFQNEGNIRVEDDILIKIINSLLLGYSFSIISQKATEYSSETENILDPDILGYVFEKTINFLTSPGDNARKQKGAYYTPEQITNHMSEKAIFYKILEKIKEGLSDSNWTKSDISKLSTIAEVATMNSMHEGTAKNILKRIDELKVVDPACGSGHFLTAALKLIVYIRKTIAEKAGLSVDLYELKRSTISLNLYGIDIEEPAVEIAKLRLWLSLIEEVDSENVNSIKTLPNIEYNIILGDSLIGWNGESLIQGTLGEIRDERLIGIFEGLEVYFADDPIGCSRLDKVKEHLFKEHPKVKDLTIAYSNLKQMYIIEQGERAVIIKRILETIRAKIYAFINPIFEEYINRTYFNPVHRNPNRPKFRVNNGIHWTLDFTEVFDNGGFDVVIGNPPYGFKFEQINRDYLRARFVSSSENGNSAMMFIERALELLKENGYLCFIVPKSLAFAQVWEEGRRIVVEHLSWTIDVSKAFLDVKLEQMIIGLLKNSHCLTYENERIDSHAVVTLEKEVLEKTGTILFSGSKDEISILKKMNASGRYFRDISTTRRGLPLQSFLTDSKTNFPVVMGRNISQYRIETPGQYLPNDTIKDQNPEVLDFLKNAKVVSQRIVAHIQNPVPHLVIMSAVNEKGLLSIDTVENTMITNNQYSAYFLVALLNSKIVAWYCYRFVFSNAIRSMDLDGYYIGKIPLPSSNKFIKEINSFIEENQEIFEAYGLTTISDEKINKKIIEIEKLIGKAYGLSEKEIEFVNIERLSLT